MSLQSKSAGVNVLTGIDLEENGLKVLTYIDTLGGKSDTPIEFSFSYKELKHDLISSYVVPTGRADGLTFDESVEQGKYRFPDAPESYEILEEVRALKEFATNLEMELLNNLQK